MRQLAIMIPITLLGVVAFFALVPEPENHAPEPSLEEFADVTHMPMVWISHDWVEQASVQVSPTKMADRRSAFGLDLRREASECLDANCRACLIDFVYGREF